MANSWARRSGVYDPYTSSDTNYELQDITIEITTPPANNIVSKKEAKNYLKIDDDITADDDLVTSLIVSASGIVERELGGTCLYQQTITQKQQGNCKHIELLRQPVIGTPTVSYYDDFDTVTATNITATTYFRLAGDRLVNSDGYWQRGRDIDGYTITYDAGLFTADNFITCQDQRLQVFKTAILRLVARMYEQREKGNTSIAEGGWSVTYDDKTMYEVRNLIMPYHTGRGIL